MKIKPLYIYVIMAAAAITALVIVANSDDTVQTAGIVNSQMPMDDIHKSFGNSQQPGRENVSSQIKQEMNKMKAKADAIPPDTAAIKDYADFLSSAHKPDEALAYYKKILDIDPKRSDVLFAMAFVYYSEQEYLKAEELTEKVFELDPSSHQALYNLGAIAATKGEKQKAVQYWERIIREFPGSSSADLAKQAVAKIKGELLN
jgi:tetratricopeptide (TPR) repeat protein